MAVDPINRMEAILAGEDVTPMNREEAILSGEDITPITRQEYFLKEFVGNGGGGGLEYVIPEQTVTIQNHIATLQNLSISSLEDSDSVIAKIVISGMGVITYQTGTYNDNEISFAPSDFGTIDTTNGEWHMSEAEDDMQVTISAIRGF